jgi:hypothetical protein
MVPLAALYLAALLIVELVSVLMEAMVVRELVLA